MSLCHVADTAILMDSATFSCFGLFTMSTKRPLLLLNSLAGFDFHFAVEST